MHAQFVVAEDDVVAGGAVPIPPSTSPPISQAPGHAAARESSAADPPPRLHSDQDVCLRLSTGSPSGDTDGSRGTAACDRQGISSKTRAGAKFELYILL